MNAPQLTIRNIRATAITVPMTYVLGTSAQAVREAPLLLVDVETDFGEILPEFHSQRETDIAETDDADTEGTLAGGFHSAKLCPMRPIECVKKASFPADIAACRMAFVRHEPLREQALVEAS